MNIFDHFNASHNVKCPKCGTSDDKPTILIPIHGTEIEPGSRTMEAHQYHLDCIDLLEQKIDGKRVVSMFFVAKD